ncbi:MAG: hypothetical protein BV456_10895, partial [Thermoplasmata archaeon M8B2D]
MDVGKLAKASPKEIRKLLKEAEGKKRYFEDYAKKLHRSFEKGKVSHDFYIETLHKHYDGKSIPEWISHYEYLIREYERILDERKGEKSSKSVLIAVFIGFVILTSFFFLHIHNLSTTGFAVSSGSPSSVETIQGTAILGQPVKWTQEISLEKPGDLVVSIPNEASNVVVKNTDSYSISNPGNSLLNKIFQLTGNAVQNPSKQVQISDNATAYEVEYETPGPTSTEQETARGKQIKVSSPENFHYKDVLAFTNLSESLNIKNPGQVRIHWLENNTYISPTKVEDTDNNGIYDYVEWNVPHLSDQTFDIIIVNAEHLDSERNLVENIYNYVNETDNITYTIPESDFVRAYFVTNLTSENVIDVYVKNSNGASIEVYEKDSNLLIGKMSITKEGLYLIPLNLSGSQDTFDLKSSGGSVEYDYIHDANEILTGVTMSTSPTSPISISGGQTFTMNCNYVMGGGKGVSEVVNIRWQYNDSGSWTSIPVGSGNIYNYVNETDNITYTIPESDFVRAYFVT